VPAPKPAPALQKPKRAAPDSHDDSKPSAAAADVEADPKKKGRIRGPANESRRLKFAAKKRAEEEAAAAAEAKAKRKKAKHEAKAGS
jgi:hypothetical protein